MRQLSPMRWLVCLRDILCTAVILTTFGLFLTLCAGLQNVFV